MFSNCIRSMWSVFEDKMMSVFRTGTGKNGKEGYEYHRCDVEEGPTYTSKSISMKDENFIQATRVLQEIIDKFTLEVYVYRAGSYVDTVEDGGMEPLMVTYVFWVLSDEEREPLRKALTDLAFSSDETYAAAFGRVKRYAPPGTRPSISGRYLYDATVCPVFKRIHDKRLAQEAREEREKEKLSTQYL